MVRLSCKIASKNRPVVVNGSGLMVVGEIDMDDSVGKGSATGVCVHFLARTGRVGKTDCNRTERDLNTLKSQS